VRGRITEGVAASLGVGSEEADDDFLSVADLGRDGLWEVLARAAAVKADPAGVAGGWPARSGLFFEKPSTRTRVSCEVAAADLGGAPVLKQDEVGLGKRESVADVARTLDRYLDILAFGSSATATWSRWRSTPRRRSSTCCPTWSTPARPWPTCRRWRKPAPSTERPWRSSATATTSLSFLHLAWP